MNRGRLVLRADAGPVIGAGHVVRGLALAEAWIGRGGTATLATDALPAWLATIAGGCGVDVIPVGCAPELVADWRVLDGYQFGPDDQRAFGDRSIVVDDHGTVGHYDTAFVIDQNLGACAHHYDDRRPTTRLLLGSRYALLRRSVLDVVRSRDPEHAPRTALVALGGSPDPALLDTVCVAVREAGLDPVVARGTSDIASLFPDVDVAVSAAGSITWELCHHGVPTVLMPLAANQVPVAQRVALAGAGIDIGRPGADIEARLGWALGVLRAERERRVAMAAAGPRIVDGRGAARVVTALTAHDLSIRPVRPDDGRRLWDWANEPTTRAMSFDSTPIAWHDHLAWLDTHLHDPSSRLYLVGDSKGRAIGHTRFTVDRDGAEIGVNIEASCRGAGVGSAVIRRATDHLLDAEPGIGRVQAWIKTENRASLGAFSLAGYHEIARGRHRSGHEAVLMEAGR